MCKFVRSTICLRGSPKWRQNGKRMNVKTLDAKIGRLREYLSSGEKRIAVLTHTNPDGDAIGSSLAWAAVLRSLGHTVDCMVPNRYPNFLAWMPGIADVVIAKEAPERASQVLDEADIIFCLDFNRFDRLENLSAHIVNNRKAVRILIDHHLDPPLEEYALAFSDHTSCSTSYLVYRIAERLTGVDVFDREAAEALYVGIMTDTGNFSFSYLTPGLFRAVADLIEKGIDVPSINSRVYNAYSEGRMRLLGYVLLQKMQLIENNRIAYIGLQENELRRFDFQIGDSEGFVNYPLSVTSVQMSAMFLETRKFIRISFRSKGNVDVSEFAARYFGGGGHKNASGGKSFEPMDKTIETFKAAVAEYFAEKQY